LGSVEVSWDGFKWFVEKDVDRIGLSKGEISVLRAFYRIASLGVKAFVDVGAHVGYYTVRMAKRCDKVIAFEPNPENRAKLQRNVELNRLKNVVIYPYAVGEGRYKSRLYLAYASSTLLEGYGGGRSSVEVDVVPLDEVVERADVIKLDVEGYEARVIEGAKNVILSQSPVLEIEHHDFRGYRISDYPVIRDFLKKRGYLELYLTGAHRLYYPSEKPLEVIAPLIADHWINFCIINLRQGRDWYYGLPYTWWWGMDFIDFIHEIGDHVLRPDESEWVESLRR
jgi:FkbM family methyltransferase